MKAVILAAGKSSRFWPLNTQYKGLFKIVGKPLIFYIIENLRKSGIKKLIIVQGPTKDIEKELRNYKFQNLEINYLIQEKPLGTGDALKRAKSFLNREFLVLYGDNFFTQEDIEKCLKKKPCILIRSVPDPAGFGQVEVQEDKVKRIIEKPKKKVSKLVNAGLYVLGQSILDFKIQKSKRGEYELTDLIRKLTKKEKLYFQYAKNWIPLSYPWDLFNINEFLLNKIKKNILGKIGKGALLRGKVIVGKNTIIKSGTHIEGPVCIGANCQVGSNCLIRKFTTIGDSCIIGQGVEIKNSIISDNSEISNSSCLRDSIIGRNCNLGAGIITANLRPDSKSVRVNVKGKLIDTKRKKLGCILGNNVRIPANASLKPGTLIGTNHRV